ncbi:MAG: MFS transporter [Allosphingosinicella sp.]|uniref:MFS transporter n=1 Tax=Allosphingosinicella sp. TaxID=2823234 RepID=UPI00392C7353
MATTVSPAPVAEVSAWAPLRTRVFAVLWGATLVGSIGTWMRDVGAGWLMTSLSPSPLMVAAVQAAAMLPVFLFALPAGALADLVDRRRLLIVAQAGLLVLALSMAVLTQSGAMTPALLLGAVLLGGIGAALTGPAWQASVPELVERPQLRAAIALNAMGVNIARAIGPAIGGALVAGFGVAAAFYADAASYLFVIAALLWWRRTPIANHLPREHLVGATVAGWRYARGSADLRRVLLRAAAFFLFASATWALLPLIARERLAGGAELYGLLLTAIGAGAVAGAIAMPRLKRLLPPERMLLTGALLIAAAAASLAIGPPRPAALALAALFGAAWIGVLTTLNVAAQAVLPNWVRARGLSVYMTTFFGSMAAGSLLWGQVASTTSIGTALLAAAGGGAAAALLMRARPLPLGEADLSPSGHWPEPSLAAPAADDHGPVMVTIDYRVDPADAEGFRAAMQALGRTRRRDGAYVWGVFQDAADPWRQVEYFLVESWAEHLRQHGRVTRADAALQAAARQFHRGPDAPKVSHLLASDRRAAGRAGARSRAPGHLKGGTAMRFGRERVKIAAGFVLAFAIGAFCRWAGVPVPAPPALVGALLVLAMTTGYILADRLLAPPPRHLPRSGGPSGTVPSSGEKA